VIREQPVDYRDAETVCKGLWFTDDAHTGARPAVLVCHTWAGRDEFAAEKAREIAALGYGAFAIDMYGEGRRGATPQECAALRDDLVADRAALARRINAAVTAVRALPGVAADRIAAMGFCMGGMCVLDLARSGADVRGVVSIHGLLTPTGLPPNPIRAKVLVLHGHDDPLAPPEDVRAFQAEMDAAQVDWQIHVYGGTAHSFTNPKAANAAGGMMYNATAARRAMASLRQFLSEVLD
jgi:dienelactone hydrolase